MIEVESSESKSSSGRSVNDHLLLWSGETSWPTTMAHHPHVRQTVLIMLASACMYICLLALHCAHMLARPCTYAHPHYCIRPLLIWGENMGANAAILYICLLAPLR